MTPTTIPTLTPSLVKTSLKEGHGANTVKQEKGEEDLMDRITKYSDLFQGKGKIEDKRNGSESK